MDVYLNHGCPCIYHSTITVDKSLMKYVLNILVILISSGPIMAVAEMPRPSSNYGAIRQWIRRVNPSVSSDNATLMAQSIIDSAETHGVDPTLITAIISVESQFNHRASHYGALGLGQLMSGTARRVGITDPFSITQNVAGTTKYFKQMMDQWQGNPVQTRLAVASYLRGPDAVIRVNGVVTSRTRRYIDYVLTQQKQVLALTDVRSESPNL